jgi:hypothetical protein
MGLNTIVRFPTHPGQEGAQFPSDFKFSDAQITSGRYPGGGFPDNVLAQMVNMRTLLLTGGGFPYVAGSYSETKTGTAAAIAQATGDSVGSLLHTAGSTSTFNTTSISVPLWTPVAGKRIIGLARLQASDITTVGFDFAIGSSQVDPHTTNYTDGIGIRMAVGAGTTTLKARGDSGTEVTQAGTTLAATTDMCMAFTATLNATAALCDLSFWMGSTFESMTHTPGSATQKAQLAAILTTPPSMYGILATKGSAGNPTVTWKYAYIGVEI